MEGVGAATAGTKGRTTKKLGAYSWQGLEILHRCVGDIALKGMLQLVNLHDRKSSVLQSPRVGGRRPEPVLRKAQVHMVWGFLQAPKSRGGRGESGPLNRRMSMQLFRILQQLPTSHTWHLLCIHQVKQRCHGRWAVVSTFVFLQSADCLETLTQPTVVPFCACFVICHHLHLMEQRFLAHCTTEAQLCMYHW